MKGCFSLIALVIALVGGILSTEPSGVHWIRYMSECNKACASKTPIASLLKCCETTDSGNFGWCSASNQAFCANKDITWKCTGSICISFCADGTDCD